MRLTAQRGRRHARDVVDQARFRIKRLVLVLREVIHFHVVAQAAFTCGRLFRARQQLDQCRFPGAVHPNQAHAIGAIDDEAHAREHLLRAIALGHASKLRHHAAARPGLGKREMNGVLLGRQLDSFDLLQLLDPALHLPRLGGLIAEAVDEHFQMVDTLLLIVVGGFELRLALLFLCEIAVVVARVRVGAPIPDFQDLVHRHVQKIAVVRHQDKSVGITFKVLFQPVARLEIEVVGGLIEQQQIGLDQQELGQRDAHLPAARKLLRRTRLILARESQAVEHGARSRRERIAVAPLELGLQAVVALGDALVFFARGVEVRHLMRERFHLLFHVEQVPKHRKALFEHAAAGQRKAVLRKVSSGDTLGGGERSIVKRLEAGQNLQQRRLAGAVSAHQADTVARRQEPVEALEQHLGAEALSG